jgi:Zn finger protein HypA/HybF involved in hydrogenase expression
LPTTGSPSTPKTRRGRPAGSRNKSQAVKSARPKTSKQRLAEYLKIPQLAVNDVVQIQNMVAMEDQMETIRKEMGKATDPTAVRKLSESFSLVSKEYRLVQEAMGLSRNQRSTEIDMQKEVDTLVADSTALVEQAGVKINCQYCVSNFEMGWIIFHFRDETGWTFTFACPYCGKDNIIMGAGVRPAPLLEKPT